MCPLLCIAKKDRSLRTVIDACQQNSNTILDVTPMPNMQVIMDNMARKIYHSKIDMMDAYEQIHIEPECIKYMGFSTPYGMFESNVMQQGDCNAPSTFQCVLTWVFRDHIGLDVHIWFNDIFIGTNTIQEHNECLLWVYECLKEEKLYISCKKINPYATVLDILA